MIAFICLHLIFTGIELISPLLSKSAKKSEELPGLKKEMLLQVNQLNNTQTVCQRYHELIYHTENQKV